MADSAVPVPTPAGPCRSIPRSREPAAAPAPISISCEGSCATWSRAVPRPPSLRRRLAFGSLSELARVNRVQGLALGAGLQLNLAGGAVTVEPRVGYGTSNERWTGGVTVGFRPSALRLFRRDFTIGSRFERVADDERYPQLGDVAGRRRRLRGLARARPSRRRHPMAGRRDAHRMGGEPSRSPAPSRPSRHRRTEPTNRIRISAPDRCGPRDSAFTVAGARPARASRR